MSYYINMFFFTELTCIPQIIDKYVGNYYNNAIGNALTWVLLLWFIIHYIFNTYLDILMKKMHYKSYKRKRLINALWFAGFYGTGFLYCAATIFKNNVSWSEYRNKIAADGGVIPLHILMGMGLIGTFFMHSFIWGLLHEDPAAFTYCSLSILSIVTFYTRRVELFLSILGVTCLSNFSFSVVRCVTTAMSQKQSVQKFALYVVLSLFVLVHGFFITLMNIVPLVYSFHYGFNFGVFTLTISVLIWWINESFHNPLFKYVQHWISHSETTDLKVCPGSVIECSLFPIRDDLSFNIGLIKQDIKSREQSMISKRKPKGRGMLVQTLKCVVAIRRKLKRNSPSVEPTESESDSEMSEDSSENESSDSEDSERKEYQEETARALKEDQEKISSQEEETTSLDDKKND